MDELSMMFNVIAMFLIVVVAIMINDEHNKKH